MVNCAAVFCHNNKRKNKDKNFFSLHKDTAVAKVLIVKLNREKNNLRNKVYVCSDHFECDCFDSSWILQSTLTYSDRPIQRHFRQGAIPMKFPHKPVKEEHFSKQREETLAKKRFVFLIHQKLLTRK